MSRKHCEENDLIDKEDDEDLLMVRQPHLCTCPGFESHFHKLFN